jgi:HEAT repeat protein
MSEARAVNPLVGQFRRGGVARDLRLMAAQGLLPLKPEDLLELWTDLVGDPDDDVRQAAERSLREFPEADLLPILKSRQTSAAVLSWAVAHRPERELRAVTLQNTSLPDATIEALAPTLTQDLAELVVINQTRLLRSTPLLLAIESNAGLNNDQKRRLRELRESFHLGKPGEAPAAEAPPPPETPPPAPSAAEAEIEPEPEPV